MTEFLENVNSQFGPILFRDLGFFMTESLKYLFVNNQKIIDEVKTLIKIIIKNSNNYNFDELTQKYAMKRFEQDNILILGFELVNEFIDLAKSNPVFKEITTCLNNLKNIIDYEIFKLNSQFIL